jgi:hypothetical protein
MKRRIAFLPLVWLAIMLCASTAPSTAEQREIISHGIGYRKMPVGNTGILFPQLTRHRNQSIVQMVHQQIDQLTKTMRCEDDGEEHTYEVRSAVTYAAKDVFSIYASASYYCGGPYPTNDSNMSVTFDLKTGKVVNFQDLFRDYKTDKKGILRTIFLQQVTQAETLAARPGNVAERGDAEGSCDNDPDLFSLEHLGQSDFSFNVAKGGLQVQPQWPHAIEACAARVTVPFYALKKFARPDGILARVLVP